MQAFIARARPNNSHRSPRAEPRGSTRGAARKTGGSALAEPGLLNRLLRRSKSKPSRWNQAGETYASIPESVDDAALPDFRRTDHARLEPAVTAQRPKTAPDVRKPATPPAADPVPPPAPAAAAALKRKPSLRDRFRFRSTSAPAPETAPRPRSAYVPTHAASDFSRMMAAPRYRISAETPAVLSTIDDDAGSEDGAAAACPARPPTSVADTESVSSTEDTVLPTTAPAGAEWPTPGQPGAPEPSADFADFLARAEEEDRAARVQVWRSVSQTARNPAATTPRWTPPALREIPEADASSPATLGGTTAVGGDSTRAARRAGHSKRATWDSGCSGALVLPAEGPPPARAAAGVKRQSVLAKKVGEYIRPSREASGYEEPGRVGARAA